jgi:hypothetical protein
MLEEDYISASTTPDNRWQLAAGEIFVMGDNRGLSLDSRSFGPVSISEVVGKAWIIYWPPSEWGLVDWRNGAVESSDDPTDEGAFRYNILIQFADGGCLWPSRPDGSGWSVA